MAALRSIVLNEGVAALWAGADYNLYRGVAAATVLSSMNIFIDLYVRYKYGPNAFVRE
jgi:hypothetical protein